MSGWKYWKDDKTVVSVAKMGGGMQPWLIGYGTPKRPPRPLPYMAKYRFYTEQEAQEFLDDYADEQGWRLYDEGYEAILAERRKAGYRKYFYHGKTLTEWCKELNLPYQQAWQRIKREGWTIEQALGFEPRKKEGKLLK